MTLHAPSVTCGATPMKGILEMKDVALIPVVFAAIIPETWVPG